MKYKGKNIFLMSMDKQVEIIIVRGVILRRERCLQGAQSGTWCYFVNNTEVIGWTCDMSEHPGRERLSIIFKEIKLAN